MSIGDKIASDIAAIPKSLLATTNKVYDTLASDIMGAGKGGSALNQNYNFESGGVGWTFNSNYSPGVFPVYVTITDGTTGSGAFQSTGYQTIQLTNNDFIPIDPSRTYNINSYLRRISGSNSGNTCYVGVSFFDSNKNFLIQNWYAASGVTPSTIWTLYQANFGNSTTNAFPANAVYMTPTILLNYGNGFVTTAPFTVPGYISDYAYQAQSIRIDEVPVLHANVIWSNTSTYNQFDIASYNGVLFISLANGNTNNIPSSSPTFWSPADQWNNTSSYNQYDIVAYQGSIYSSLVNSNTNNIPPSSPASWVLATATSSATQNTNYYLSYVAGLFDTGVTTGWNLYNNASGSTPTTGTGGVVINLTFNVNNTTPLVGNYDARLVLTANNDIGEGLSYDFTVDNAAVYQPLYFSFYYTTTSNYASGDISVWIYDKTNAVLIAPSSQSIPAAPTSTYYTGFFIPNSNSTQYRLIYHISTPNSLGYTFEIDQVFVGRINTLTGTAIGGWTSFPMVISGTVTNPTKGTITSEVAQWRRVGSNMEVLYHLVQTTVGAADGSGDYLFNLPTGYTIDYTKLATASGTSLGFTLLSDGHIVVTGPHEYVAQMEAPFGVSSTGVAMEVDDYTNNRTAHAGSSFLPMSTITELHVAFTVPITQWSNNINLVSDFTEYAWNTTTTTTTDQSGTNNGYGTQGALIQAFAPSGTANIVKRCSFQRPIQPTDLIVLEINDGSGWATIPNGSSISSGPTPTTSSTSSSPVYYGVNLQILNSTQVDVYFWAYANLASQPWSGVSTSRWRVRKTSQGNFAEQTPALILLPRDATNRSIVNVTGIPAQGAWSGTIQATGNAGIPAGAKALKVNVFIADYVTTAGSASCRIGFSDGNSQVPTYDNAIPIAMADGYNSVTGLTVDSNSELTIPLNASGQFYLYTLYVNNVTVGSTQLKVSVKGYYTGGIQT
jgi:hypothetical protein